MGRGVGTPHVNEPLHAKGVHLRSDRFRHSAIEAPDRVLTYLKYVVILIICHQLNYLKGQIGMSFKVQHLMQTPTLPPSADVPLNG